MASHKSPAQASASSSGANAWDFFVYPAPSAGSVEGVPPGAAENGLEEVYRSMDRTAKKIL